MEYMNNNELLGKRVIIELVNGVAFAGILKATPEIDGKVGYLVNTDQKNQICVWSPCESTKRIISVPIGDEK